ncbi:unnamed protein product [marine sediment metagenome]|uniref:Putative regulatory protein FmdB zinc ribbon domain-containing protein n=1 Tax=marine sediment metagenome TaxID=412755 RepID=X1DQ50_9ZZZZ
MPLYEYQCPECNEVGECLVSVAERDTHEVICLCGKRMKRVLTVANFGTPKYEGQVITGDGRKVKGTWAK